MEPFTIFLWGDTHFGYDDRFGADDLRWRIIDQMHALPGWPYPEEIGGVVDTPSFVILCGDLLEGGSDAASEMACARYHLSRLRFPHRRTLGNHDLAPAHLAAFRTEYGDDSYAFAMHGCHFLCLAASYDAGESAVIPENGLAWLDRTLATIPASGPIILFVHSRLDRTHNGGEVLARLRGRKVLLITSAHIHRVAHFRLEGIPCVDIGQCRNHPSDPEMGRSFSVLRVTENRLTVVPWRWDLRDWDRGQRWADPAARRRGIVLDTEIPFP